MNQYTITEDELGVIERDDFFKFFQDKQPWERRKCFTALIRSRPYQSEKCVYWGQKDGKNCCSLLIPEPDLYVELTEAIHKDEREKVLNEFYERLKVERDPIFDGVSWDDIDRVFIKLRQAGEP